MTSHTSDSVVEDNADAIALVVPGIHQTCDTAVEECLKYLLPWSLHLQLVSLLQLVSH